MHPSSACISREILGSYRKDRVASPAPSYSLDYVPIDAFGSSYLRVVNSLYGKPGKLLGEAGLSMDVLSRAGETVEYRAMAELFARTSVDLQCPDLGLRLANERGNWLSVLGPLEPIMRNAATLRQAMSYCSRYMHVYSGAVHFSLETDSHNGREYMLWDLLVNDLAYPGQVTEHAFGLTFNAIKELTNGVARPTEVWFSHNPIASLSFYREYFGVPVRFGRPYNAIYFDTSSLDVPIANRNPTAFDMGLRSIEKQYPNFPESIARRVRIALVGLLAKGCPTQTAVAEALEIHPRTLQRRLNKENTTFEEVLSIVRREIALRNLLDPNVSFGELVDKLGYSEAAVLTRSCYRWFNKSPRQIRKETPRLK